MSEFVLRIRINSDVATADDLSNVLELIANRGVDITHPHTATVNDQNGVAVGFWSVSE